jgi:hypothetical protein
MRVRSLVLALVAASLGSPKGSEPQAVVTRVYRGNDFGHYYSDPPYWSYLSAYHLNVVLLGHCE